MMTSGATGVGGGVLVIAGGGDDGLVNGGKPGKLTMPGGKFTELPTYRPHCVRNTIMNGS